MKKAKSRSRKCKEKKMSVAPPSDYKLRSAEFRQIAGKIASLFSRYTAKDVYLSLLTSELWLPNIASQVKHWLSYTIFCSMKSERFACGSAIDTYIAFSEFLSELYAIVPDFSMLEDYVPEGDWGEVRYSFDEQQFFIFYGQNVERIVDFAAAFELLQGSNSSALADLYCSLRIQDSIIRSVDSIVVGDASDIDAGHIEVPGELFWRLCVDSIAANFGAAHQYKCSDRLVTTLGDISLPATLYEFGNGVMESAVLPFLFVNIDGHNFPLNVRGAIAATIEYWHQFSRLHGRPRMAMEMAPRVAKFLARRFDHDHLWEGPFQLVTRDSKLPHLFSGLLMGTVGMQLIR